MSGKPLFVDTNILLYLRNGNAEIREVLADNEIYTSFITQIEILVHPDISGQKAEEMANLLSTCTIIDITDDIKIETVRIRRAHKLKLPDAIIAATAAVLKIPLITADRKFARLTEESIL